jgi:putative membrane protein
MFLLYPGGGWIGILVLIATALISWFFLRRVFFRTWTIGERPFYDGEPDHLELLKRRYAKGEISREDYQRMKEELKDEDGLR